MHFHQKSLVPHSYFVQSQNNSKTHFRTSTKNVTSRMHLSMKKCHDQKQRGIGRLETKCSDGTDPLTGSHVSSVVCCALCKKIISMNPPRSPRQTINEHCPAHAHSEALQGRQNKKFFSKMNVCSIFKSMHLNQEGQEEEKRKQVKRCLENLSLKNLSTKRLERLLPKSRYFFSTSLGMEMPAFGHIP